MVPPNRSAAAVAKLAFAACLAALVGCAGTNDGGSPFPIDAGSGSAGTSGQGRGGASAGLDGGVGGDGSPAGGAGVSGTAGTTGSAGTSASGTAGSGTGSGGAFSGAAGTTGQAGTTGAAGRGTGSAGTTGAAGTTGNAGTTGAAGFTGTGAAGRGGASGAGGGARGGSTGTAGTLGAAGTTGAGGGGGGGGGAGTGGPPVCGGSASTACASSAQFCQFAIGACATVDPVGSCVTKPLGCDPLIAPVCGCDGRSYANDCERQAAGISLWANGVCSSPTCPLTAPQGGASCTQGNIACVYSITTGPDAGCVQRLSCMDGTWSAPVVVCPD